MGEDIQRAVQRDWICASGTLPANNLPLETKELCPIISCSHHHGQEPETVWMDD